MKKTREPMTELTPSAIHQQDQDRIAEIREALTVHTTDNNEQFRLNMIHNSEVNLKLDGITAKLTLWTPYITEGMKKSDAYNYVANDLKSKGKNVKWWVGFVIILFTFMSVVYSVLERVHFIK